MPGYPDTDSGAGSTRRQSLGYPAHRPCLPPLLLLMAPRRVRDVGGLQFVPLTRLRSGNHDPGDGDGHTRGGTLPADL